MCESVNVAYALTLPVDASSEKASTDFKRVVGERMRVAREACGLTQSAFCAQFGYKLRTYQKNEAGDSEAGMFLLGAFARAGISANWLLTGEGPMRLADLAPKPQAPQVNVTALSAIIRGLIEAGAPADKVGATAWRYYCDAIAESLITQDSIGEGGKTAA